MKNLPAFIGLFLSWSLQAQTIHYSSANAHSHNDYEQKVPFWLAYRAGFGSIEADIFLYQGDLLVAHDEKELAFHKTLKTDYLDNLRQCIKKNGGYPYPDSSRKIQLLVDIKTESIQTLNNLISLLNTYPEIIGNSKISIVITGNRPDPVSYIHYPDNILFDGVLSESYTSEALSKISMISDNFKKYSVWDGIGEISSEDRKVLQEKVNKMHSLRKPVRFWNAPDNR